MDNLDCARRLHNFLLRRQNWSPAKRLPLRLRSRTHRPRCRYAIPLFRPPLHELENFRV